MRTTYHDFDGWPRPMRAPQHAAVPFGQSSAARIRAHRALRVFGTAGLWAAGLCLVVGAIVLVVSQARPGRLTPAAATTSTRTDAGRHGARQPHPARHATPPASLRAADRGAAARVLAALSGHGDMSTHTFRTSAARGWQIRWTYSCAASSAGQFLVADAGSGGAGTSISQSGVAGQGITSLSPSGRTHQLIVISTCSWTMKVTQQR